MPVPTIVKEVMDAHTENMKQLKEDFTILLEGAEPPSDTVLKVKEARLAETNKHLTRLKNRKEEVLKSIDKDITEMEKGRTLLEIEVRDLKRRIKRQKEEFTAKAKSASSGEDESTTPRRGSGGIERGEIEL